MLRRLGNREKLIAEARGVGEETTEMPSCLDAMAPRQKQGREIVENAQLLSEPAERRAKRSIDGCRFPFRRMISWQPGSSQNVIKDASQAGIDVSETPRDNFDIAAKPVIEQAHWRFSRHCFDHAQDKSADAGKMLFK
jgi:hypothetical protein